MDLRRAGLHVAGGCTANWRCIIREAGNNRDGWSDDDAVNKVRLAGEQWSSGAWATSAKIIDGWDSSGERSDLLAKVSLPDGYVTVLSSSSQK